MRGEGSLPSTIHLSRSVPFPGSRTREECTKGTERHVHPLSFYLSQSNLVLPERIIRTRVQVFSDTFCPFCLVVLRSTVQSCLFLKSVWCSFNQNANPPPPNTPPRKAHLLPKGMDMTFCSLAQSWAFDLICFFSGILESLPAWTGH